MDTNTETTKSEIVPEYCQCPECGEDRMDWLTWSDAGDELECQTCSAVYRV